MFNINNVQKLKRAVHSYKTTNSRTSQNYRLNHHIDKNIVAKNNYPILKSINTNIYDLNNVNTNKKFHICIYKITHFRDTVLLNTNKYLEYLLYNNTGSYIFPHFKLQPGENLNIKINKFLKKLHIKQYISDCIGYYKVLNGDYYLFFEGITLNSIKEDDYYSWATMDDICNVKKILRTPVSSDVTKLFYTNYNLIHILDNDGERIETPKTVYKPKHKKKMFELLGTNINSFLGPYYYFYTDDIVNDYTGEIEKYRVFTGKIKIIHHHYGELDEYSKLLKKQQNLTINSKSIDKDDKEVQEIKKSWPEIYDTLMIGKIQSKSNGKFLNKYPIIVSKSREQNIFISSYTI
tara:strand:+ start:2605 stop:3651 length:1047 start_codon:yes stop_codon:yes gene_type:complete